MYKWRGEESRAEQEYFQMGTLLFGDMFTTRMIKQQMLSHTSSDGPVLSYQLLIYLFRLVGVLYHA